MDSGDHGSRPTGWPRQGHHIGRHLPLLLALACSHAEETGPGEIRWDRETCVRCAMAVSDRHFSAQVRGGPADQRTTLYAFDDLGCAVIWLAAQEWSTDPRTEIWVTDHQTGDWIEARAAHYTTGHITPMDYGLGASPTPSEGSVDYATAVATVGERGASRPRPHAPTSAEGGHR